MAGAEHTVAGLELCHATANRLDLACHVHAESHVLGLAQSGNQANEVRPAAQEVPVIGVDRSGADLDQNLVVPGNGRFDFPDLDDVRRTILGVDSSFHTRAASCVAPACSFQRCGLTPMMRSQSISDPSPGSPCHTR
jgi:hypothetical protein